MKQILALIAALGLALSSSAQVSKLNGFTVNTTSYINGFQVSAINGFTIPGGGWTPASEASLVSWYDASTATTAGGGTYSGNFTNGANVGISGTTPIYDNAPGHSYSLTNSVNVAPLTYSTNVQNSQNVFVGTGSTSFAPNTGGYSASTFPYILVGVTEIPTVNGGLLGSSNQGGLSFGINISGGVGAVYYNKSAEVGGPSSTTTMSEGTWHTYVLVVTSSTYAYYIDGSAAGNGTNSISLTAGCTFVLASDCWGDGQVFESDIGEAQVYAGSIPTGGALTTLLANIHTYCSTKWGTP